MEKLLNFSLDDISLFQDDDDQDFSLARFRYLADGNNSHKNPISLDVLKRDAHTALGKFVIGKYDPIRNDTRGHEATEEIYGYIPPNGTVSFEQKDGKTFATVDGVLSKLYATPVVELFKSNKKKSVSCEFTAQLGEKQQNGDEPIEAFTIRAITILGQDIRPSCKGAEVEMMKFSECDAEKYYNRKHDTLSELQRFSERRKQEFMAEKTYKVDTSREAISDGEWEGNKAKHDAIKAKNFESIAPKIFMRLEDGWKDKEVTKLGYPVMELKGDTWVYNKKGLASALGYAKQENDTEIIGKIMSLYKKLGLDDGEGEKEKMEKFEIEGRKAWGEVIKEVQDHKKGAYVDSVEKDHIIYTVDNVRYRVDADVEVGKDDKKVHAKIHWDTVKKDADQKEFEEKKYPEDDAHSTDEKDKKEVEDDDEHDKEEAEKKMSLDANADMAAYYEMLENETSEYKDLAKRILEDEERGLVMADVLNMAHECMELRSFKEQKMNEMRDMECNKLMAEVKEDLDAKQFKDLQAECMACKYEDITAIANKYRAMAYACAKEKMAKGSKIDETKQFARMGFDFSSYIHKSDSLMNADDIYKEYINK